MSDFNSSTLTLDIADYAENSYLEYAVAVVTDRALMRVSDGNKPVHRRILYAMRQLGLWADVKPVKSARIVGDVLGKYHPHGDSSVYDALVRMAQDFSLRYPLVEGQGNFGSRDGDGAAAMRYTESRLSPIARLLLEELNAGTVDFVPNYDGSQSEPNILPARLPFTLLNGTSGIAVGMASEVPSHNIREVCAATIAVLENPSLTTEELLEYLPGPDFPDGGQLVSTPAEIAHAYEAGHGPLRMRARWSKEELSRGQWQIVVTELPYGVSSKKVLEELAEMSNPQIPKDKKVLTQKQINLKNLTVDFLEGARDESNKDSVVRIVLSPKNSKVDSDQMMEFLVANTSLSSNFGLNNTVLDLNGSPQCISILKSLRDFCEFRKLTVRRRTQNEVSIANARIHILEGRIIALRSLSEIIELILSSDEPKVELMAKFGLTEVQAEDILEMRIRQLSRLENLKQEKELDSLRKEIVRLQKILDSSDVLKELIISEIKADCEKYGDDRRTLIKPEERLSRAGSAPKTVLSEPLTVVLSKNLWVRAYKGVNVAEESFVFKATDSLLFKSEGSTSQSVALIDSKGRTYSFSPAELPQRGEGVPLSTLIELQENAKPIALLSGAETDLVLFANSSGLGFTTTLKSLLARPKTGKTFAVVDQGEALHNPFKISSSKEGYLLLFGTDAKMLAIDIKEVPLRPTGGKGVVLMGVEPGGLLQPQFQMAPRIAYTVDNAKGKPVDVVIEGEDWLKYVGKRARKGAYLPNKLIPPLPISDSVAKITE